MCQVPKICCGIGGIYIGEHGVCHNQVKENKRNLSPQTRAKGIKASQALVGCLRVRNPVGPKEQGIIWSLSGAGYTAPPMATVPPGQNRQELPQGPSPN